MFKMIKNNFKNIIKASKESLKISDAVAGYHLLYKLWQELHKLEEADDIYAFEKLQWESPAFFCIVKMIKLCEFLVFQGYVPEIHPDISGAAAINLTNSFNNKSARFIIYNDSLSKIHLQIIKFGKSSISFSYQEEERDRLLHDLKKYL